MWVFIHILIYIVRSRCNENNLGSKTVSYTYQFLAFIAQIESNFQVIAGIHRSKNLIITGPLVHLLVRLILFI